MRRNLVVAAALILSACSTLPNGFGYVATPGKQQAMDQAHAYLTCWQEYTNETFGFGAPILETPRQGRIEVDKCMTGMGWTDVSLDAFGHN
jgi:starvation-inducible outer membrane lipoprotein